MIRYKIIYLVLIIAFGYSQNISAQTITINQAVEEALTNNPEMLKAEQIYKSESAGFWNAISPDYPEIFIEMEGLPEGNTSLNHYEVKKTGISQSLDFPLNYLFKGQRQYYQKKQAEGNYLSVRNQVLADTKKQFYRLLELNGHIKLYKEMLNLSRDNVEKARIRVLSGESSPYDTLKVKVDLLETENRLLAIQKEKELGLQVLKKTIGRNINNVLKVGGELAFDRFKYNSDSLHTIAFINHPKLLYTMSAYRQMRAENTLAWMSLLPNIHLRYFKQEFRDPLLGNAWGGEIGFSVPLWFFLKGQGNIRSSGHQKKAARIEKDFVKMEVTLGVNSALAELELAEKQVDTYQKNGLLEVDELVRIAKRSYEEGEMGYLELAEALRAKSSIYAGYLETLYRYAAAIADLELAVGVTLK